MALVVTPGAPNANAFADFNNVKAYAAERGLSFAQNEEQGAPSIIRATTWLSTAWSWKGWRTNGRGQSLAHPRAGMTDAEGNTVDSNVIATEIVQACCEASIYEFKNPGGLAPIVVLADRIKSEAIGPIRTEYVVGQQTAEASRPILTIVSDLVSGLVGGGSNPLTGTAVRG